MSCMHTGVDKSSQNQLPISSAFCKGVMFQDQRKAISVCQMLDSPKRGFDMPEQILLERIHPRSWP